VAVPSLNLIKQSLEDWTREFEAIGQKHRPLWKIICSDKSVSSIENDEFVTDVASLGVPTTDLKDLTKFLKESTKGKKIVFTTYQSSQILAEASRKAKFRFDFAILDEAHKTVGEKSKSFATLLSDRNIQIKKRMFMTATERVLKGKNDDVHSMDDVSVYGDRFYQLTFKAAIQSKPNIISDYKILTIAVSDSQIKELVQKNRLLSDKKGKINDQEAQSLAAAIALRQATKQYGIKHAISFHKSIKSAEKFTELNQDLNKQKANRINLSSFHISSKKSTGERSKLIEDFKSESLALMTNARCLTEGVNIPAIDCVLFADPKQSVVDIVQAAGRALRVSKGKKFGYIMLPIVVPDKSSIEKFTESTPFKQVARIITALSTQDERIVEEFRQYSKGKIISEKRVEITGSIPNGLKLDISRFTSGVQAKFWEKIGRANWRSYSEAHQYISSMKFRNVSEWRKFSNSGSRPFDIPSRPNDNYKNCGWTTWGAFLGSEAIATKDINFLTYDEAHQYIKRKKFKTITQFNEFLLSENCLGSIPSHPEITYKNKGWKGWSKFLGAEIVSNKNKTFYPLKIAKENLVGLNLSKTEYLEKRKKGSINKLFPGNPRSSYKDSGWISWGDYLGTNTGKQEYLSFLEARQFAQAAGLMSNRDWSPFIKKLKRLDLPKSPDVFYRNSGWKGWPDFLGKDKSSPGWGKFLPFNDAKKLAGTQGFTHRNQWKEFVKKSNRNDIPKSAETVYKNHGWNGWADFLGKG
jgi:superfamily II DNA or RNA helicase